MRSYKTPELSIHRADAFSHQLSPVAELAYCFEEVVLEDTGGGINISACVDRGQWPGFDGTSVDEVYVSVQAGTQPIGSTEISFGGGSGNPIWCGTEYVGVPSNGVYTVTLDLVIDGDTVCTEEYEVPVGR